MKALLLVHWKACNGGVCPVSLYPKLVVLVCLENFVPFVDVGNAAVNVFRKFSKDFLVFLKLVFLEDALVMP